MEMDQDFGIPRISVSYILIFTFLKVKIRLFRKVISYCYPGILPYDITGKLFNKTAKLEKSLMLMSMENHSILQMMLLSICLLVIFISLIQFLEK